MSEIVKTCKVHGGLTKEQTWIKHEPKRGKSYVRCRLCQRENKLEWENKNKERVAATKERIRNRRLAERAQGTLKKTCKRHGELLLEQIRIDRRGTRMCRLCDAEVYRKKTEEMREHDRERIRKRRAANPERAREVRMQAYYRMVYDMPKLTKPWTLRTLTKERQNERNRRRSKELKDYYIRKLLHAKKGDVPQKLIELKRALTILKREIKE